MTHSRRKELIWIIVGELARWWLISCLMYFMAVAAEASWLMVLLEISIIGIPMFLSTSFFAILAGATYFYTLNRMAWQRKVYYVGMDERVRRLSITDVHPGEAQLLRWQAEQERLERLR
jgi:ribose/xylose/arabinose/galactoside ABC-type transport system permease subunit